MIKYSEGIPDLWDAEIHVKSKAELDATPSDAVALYTDDFVEGKVDLSRFTSLQHVRSHGAKITGLEHLTELRQFAGYGKSSTAEAMHACSGLEWADISHMYSEDLSAISPGCPLRYLDLSYSRRAKSLRGLKAFSDTLEVLKISTSKNIDVESSVP